MAKTKKCSECMAEIPKEAKKCQHCGSKQKKGVGLIGGTFLVLLAFATIPAFINSIIGTSTDATTISQTSNNDEELAALVKKNNETKRKMAIEEFTSAPETTLAKLNDQVKNGQAKKAMDNANRYLKAGVDNPGLNEIIEKAKVAINKQKEKDLLAEVKLVPATDLEKNRDLYAQLVKINPSNKSYKYKMTSYQKKIDKKETEIAARKIAFGDKPVASPWDGSYSAVERYLKKVANDPDSIDMAGCTRVFYNDYGWLVGCKYRGKNAFGGMVLNANWFTINHGQVVKVDDANAYKWN